MDFKNTIRIMYTLDLPIIIHSIQKQTQECVRECVCVYLFKQNCVVKTIAAAAG